MANNIDIAYITDKISALFGIKFEGNVEEFDGGLWSIIRPTDLIRPNGFGVVVESTATRVDAKFQPDSHAGQLMQLIPQESKNSFLEFDKIMSQAEDAGQEVSFSVNQSHITSLSDFLSTEPWRRIDLNCSLKFPVGHKTNEILINKYALETTKTCFKLLLEILPLIIVEPFPIQELGYPEGSQIKLDATRYVRDPRNRSKCLDYHGYSCKACGLDFGEQYGPAGEGFIEVHHITPVSQLGDSYIIDPVKDLIPLCSNCHSIAHRDRHQQKPRSVLEIQELLEIGNQVQ